MLKQSEQLAHFKKDIDFMSNKPLNNITAKCTWDINKVIIIIIIIINIIIITYRAVRWRGTRGRVWNHTRDRVVLGLERGRLHTM